jgi:hypothetical protein
MRTTDCVNFSYYDTGTGGVINEINYLNGYFYVVCSNGAIARSLTGVTWSIVSGAAPWFGKDIKDIAYIGTNYVLISDGSAWQTSTNLTSWTTYTGDGPSNFVTRTSTQLVSIGFNSATSQSVVRTSTNGVTWTTQGNLSATSISYNGTSKYVAVQGVGSFIMLSSADLFTWTNIDVSFIQGVGVIIRDSASNVRLQSYDTTLPNYLCTRVVQEDYVNADATTIYVTGADGYKIFVVVTVADQSTGGFRIPYIEYHRGAAPTYQPYYIVRYPVYGGSGSSPSLAPVYCTTFTTGAIENTTY